MVTPVHCSEVLRAWIGDLTTGNREKLLLWGISSRTLNVAEVEVSRHLLCAAARFWKPSLHVFCFGKVEMTPTLEEVRRIYGLSPLLGPAVFMRREGYASVLCQLTGVTTRECAERLICTDGSAPRLHLEYFEQMIQRCATLGDDLWLKGFVTCFLGELIFSHGRLTVATEVAKIALAVVSRQIDLTPVILAETFYGLDRISHHCRHFHGCVALVQVNCQLQLLDKLICFMFYCH